MTALKEYERLESGGLWRASADAQRRDVVVSFGNATLVIADGAGRPITHWSLAAVERDNPGTRPALFKPAEDAEEVLEIEDSLMIDAIEKVRKSVARSRPRKGKLRGVGTAVCVLALVVAGFVWLPGALRDQAQSALPASKRTEIGVAILNVLQELTGPVCRGAEGRAALARLRTRLTGADVPGEIVVLPLEQDTALALPGGIVAVDRGLVERLEDPFVLAGFVLAAQAGAAARDPLLPVLEEAGFANTLRLLATSDLPEGVVEAHAAGLIGDRAPAPLPEAALLPAFSAANVPSGAYGRYLQAQGAPVMDLIVNDPVPAEGAPEVMSDRDWVALQGICDG